jgi:uncharacterized protein (DUF1501 family)
MNRRELLIAAGALGASLTTLRVAVGAPAPGTSTAGPRFLLVFLRGGYDCANAVVPCGSSFYYEARPSIAIAKPLAENAAGALALDADWALAPALRGTIGSLYTAGQAAFIPFAGTEDLSRSHFETQDSIELGQPQQGARDFGSGFLARLNGTLVDGRPIAFTDALPLCLRGKTDIPNISLRNVGKPPFDDRQAQLLKSMYDGHHLEPAVSDGLELRATVAREMETEMQDANRGAVTTKGFELEAERVGRLMRDQYRLGFIDVGGWDTHVNEGGAQGALATNLESLGRGLQVFAQTLGPQWHDTVVVVLSEFGRTFRENGNRGTDHGHGSVHWVLGGGVAGGRIAGEQVQVARATLLQDRDYPVLNNYRSVLGGLYRRMWGLSPAQLERVFPGSPPVDLALV